MTMFSQWWLSRLPVLLSLPAFFIDIEIFFFLISFIFLHLTIGLKGIINDYLHNKKSKLFLIILIRLCNFEFLRYVLEFLL
uniref:Succinate:cytochrome c oxidoreductase subunit 4 n=1 Tax=Lithothamnion sp. TaxID=1940749 RepID=A0A3G3MIA4_9FLOR|nr:succinate:cytochrome c oxidoreductase subunit 4 [Lithothamnion sp.]